MSFTIVVHNPWSFNLQLSHRGRHFRWTVAVDGDLLIGGRPVFLGWRRTAPELIRRLADSIAAATVVLVLVIHVAEAEGDRRPNHQGELPFWQRTAASHATRGGHNSFNRELLFVRGHGHHDATPVPRRRWSQISHRCNWRVCDKTPSPSDDHADTRARLFQTWCRCFELALHTIPSIVLDSVDTDQSAIRYYFMTAHEEAPPRPLEEY